MTRYSYRPSIKIAAVAVGTIATTYVFLFVYSNVSKYGFSGTWNLVWEGDPLPPNVRLAMDELDELEYSKLPKQERLLEQLELEIEVASLNSIDDGVMTFSSLRQTNTNTTSDKTSCNSYVGGVHVTGKTKQKIAMLSSTLDDLVASIDSIPSLQTHELKQRKKVLSNIAVKLLERVDILISKVNHQ